MDCWWNAAVENQGRLSSVFPLFALTHNHPSHRPTTPSYARTDRLRQTFHREMLPTNTSTTSVPDLLVLQIENTIEGRILQIQKRKTAIVKEAFKGKGKGGAGEKHDAESMKNLKIMFGMGADEVLTIFPTQRTQRS